MGEPSPGGYDVTIDVTHATDRTAWDEALAMLPHPHILQTWDWGDFKSRWGWQVTRLQFAQDGQPVAAAQVLRRKLVRTPLSVTYVPKGPAMDYADTGLMGHVLAALEGQARQERSLFVKIDRDVQLGIGPVESPPSPQAAAVLDVLSCRGWISSKEQIQFKNTVVVDLTPDEGALLARMKPKTRYNIRLAERRGVEIRHGDESGLEVFYRLYHHTAQRDGFLIRPAAYYLDVWTQFLRAGRAHLLLADVEGELTAGLMLFHFGRTAWYMYGASSNRHRKLMPNHLLQWQAMRLAKELACTRYDMWGAPDHFSEQDSMWGVYRFKVGFGGETIRGLGAYDYPSSRWLYWAYATAMPRVLALMRRRHQTG
jgi:lipid II:glycine glycyltransferase (peptidoglycan interpeptide bridge formation enzyme)